MNNRNWWSAIYYILTDVTRFTRRCSQPIAKASWISDDNSQTDTAWHHPRWRSLSAAINFYIVLFVLALGHLRRFRVVNHFTIRWYRDARFCLVREMTWTWIWSTTCSRWKTKKTFGTRRRSFSKWVRTLWCFITCDKTGSVCVKIL